MTENERKLLEQCSNDLLEIKAFLRNLSSVVSETIKTEISEQITSTLEPYTKSLQKVLNSYIDDNEVEAVISKTLQEIGIPCNFKGYNYLCSAISICIEEPSTLNSLTKKLYPLVADIHETTSSRVESAIKHAIERAYTHGNIEYLNTIFSHTISLDRGKPTNKEFIATLVTKIKI